MEVSNCSGVGTMSKPHESDSDEVQTQLARASVFESSLELVLISEESSIRFSH